MRNFIRWAGLVISAILIWYNVHFGDRYILVWFLALIFLMPMLLTIGVED